ncbi:MAG TPA: hypothetical protein VGP63_02670 [Planctomycetaceae bacterium]|jgi:hypothetical protein|nr:hypothetical protein [Planctomycetaceae bacterium]
MADFFGVNLWQQIVGTFFGVLGAYGIYLLQNLHHKTQQQRELDARQGQLLAILKRTVQRLQIPLSGLTTDAIKHGPIVLRVDTAALEWLSVQEAAAFPDVTLRDQMNHLRDVLKQLDNSLTLLVRLDFDPASRHAMMRVVDGRQDNLYDHFRPKLATAVQCCAVEATKVCDALLAALLTV